MAYFTLEQWVALSALSGIGILAILSVLARRFEHDRALHDLRVQTTALRRDYSIRIAALKAGREPLEVEVVEAREVEDAPLQAAA